MATQLKSADNEYGIKSEYGHYIGGEWVAGDSGKTIDLLNPSTGKVLTKIQAGNAKDIERAIAAAKAAIARMRLPVEKLKSRRTRADAHGPIADRARQNARTVARHMAQPRHRRHAVA